MDTKKNPEGESREIQVQQSSEDKTATVVSTTSNQPKSADSSVSLPSFGLKRKSSSGISSSNGGSGNNSDNSANSGMVSLGNNSFGFNFDCEEGFSNSSPTLNSDDGDAPKRPQQLKKPRRSEQETPQHSEAAENAVANLTSIANTYKNANQEAESSSGGAVVSVSSGSADQDPSRPNKKSKKMDENKREERNAREKERSFRISRQINELRNLLSSGGVIVPKGTKSSVLTEAANYIRMLQQHQYRSEIDRHQLVQQMQMIGSGALGPQAATAIRHVAAQNGVWSLGNFGGVPPKSAMTFYNGVQPNPTGSAEPQKPPTTMDPNAPVQTKIEDHEYRFVFNSCSVGMAIASMGGAFIDCNNLFCQLSNYTKQEVCAMTIFNMTSRQDLQHAFDLISRMISPPVEGGSASPCLLRGSMKERHDLGLSVALIKGDDNIAKCFCVTLIKNPASPFDPNKPIPATADMIQQTIVAPTKDESGNLNSSPAYTTG